MSKNIDNRSSAFSQFKTLFTICFRGELKNKERLMGPFIFGAVVLIMFSFATGEIDSGMKAKIFTAEVVLTTLFALSLYFIRAFETEYEDGIFLQIRSMNVSRVAWFFSKYTLVSLLSLTTSLVVLVITALFTETSTNLISDNFGQLLLILIFTVAGLSALGILLSAMTLKARGRSVVFPLLFYPLSVPVLLCSTQAINLLILKSSSFFATEWGLLLVGFDVMYIILSALLFEVIID